MNRHVVARRRAAPILFALALLPACGRKTPPRPPELVRPQAIRDLQAERHQDGILLSWKRPEKYADGTRMIDLAGFRVQRRCADGPFESLATLEVADRDRFRQMRHFRYVDQSGAEPDCRYRVFSFTLTGDYSEPSNDASLSPTSP